MILLPLITYYGIWGPSGSLAIHQTYLKNRAETIDNKEIPCIVCGVPGYERNYRKIGSGLSNPFDYEGPYIYCSRHTEQTPLGPYSLGWEHIKKGASFIIAFAFLILMISENIWGKSINKSDAEEMWRMLGILLFLFVLFFYFV